MKLGKTLKTVRKGSLRLDVRAYAGGRFGFDYAPPGEDRIRVRVASLDVATERAAEIVGMAHGGKVQRMEIDAGEYAEFLRWKADRRAPAMVENLVPLLLAARVRKGVTKHTLREIKSTLTPFAKAFPGAISEVQRADVEEWIENRGVGPRRFNNMRASIIALYRFARDEALLSVEKTPVERIEKRKTAPQIETYTPAELAKYLAAVPPEWLPLIALGAFAGIRPEEISPDFREGEAKPGLRWENILWDKDKIDIPKEVAKDRRRRFAPLLPCLKSWLEGRRGEAGPVVPRKLLDKLRPKWAKAAGVEWRNDAWRHSFASYRLAIRKDMPALALEMGNSSAMLFKHYLDLKHEEEAQEWFSTVPSRAIPATFGAPDGNPLSVTTGAPIES